MAEGQCRWVQLWGRPGKQAARRTVLPLAFSTSSPKARPLSFPPSPSPLVLWSSVRIPPLKGGNLLLQIRSPPRSVSHPLQVKEPEIVRAPPVAAYFNWRHQICDAANCAGPRDHCLPPMAQVYRLGCCEVLFKHKCRAPPSTYNNVVCQTLRVSQAQHPASCLNDVL